MARARAGERDKKEGRRREREQRNKEKKQQAGVDGRTHLPTVDHAANDSDTPGESGEDQADHTFDIPRSLAREDASLALMEEKDASDRSCINLMSGILERQRWEDRPSHRCLHFVVRQHFLPPRPRFACMRVMPRVPIGIFVFCAFGE